MPSVALLRAGRRRHRRLVALALVLLVVGTAPALFAQTPSADEIVRETGVEAGLAVHVGATDGALEIALARPGRLVVHGLALDRGAVAEVRRAVERAGLCGRVSVEAAADLRALPYATNLVNLLVTDLDALGKTGPAREEILRVLAPGGAAFVKQGGRWQTVHKPRPEGMDEWTHLNHGADGNPVSADRLVRPPHGVHWIASKPMGWGSFSIRSTGGRVFLFWDTLIQWVDPRPNMLKIEARDAASGVLLWEEYYPFPVKERTRPVAVGQRIYLLAGRHVIGIDAADGRQLATYRECETPFDCVFSDGTVICRNDREICAFEAESGKLRWRFDTREHPEVLARYAKRRQGHFEPGWRRQLLVVGDGKVFFADHRPVKGDAEAGETGARVVGLDVRTGQQVWQAAGEHVGELPHPCFYYEGVLMLTNEHGYAGVPVAGRGEPWQMPTLSWKEDRRHRFGGFTGIGIAGFLGVDGLVWIKDRQQERLGDNRQATPEEKPFKGWIGVDPHSGEVKRRIYYPSKEYWSGRCYADVAVPGCIYADNLEMIDLKKGGFANFRAARGQCGTGHIFANGLTYTSPNRCVSCYPMIRGAVALCGEEERGLPIGDGERLWRGAVLPSIPGGGSRVGAPRASARGYEPESSSADSVDWPMYRHDSLRTNATPMPLPERLLRRWEARLSERASPPVVAGGKVFVSVVNEGRIVALDAETGEPQWSFVAGSRIDTPPTIHGRLCLFGCHDGTVTCLRADDGELLWQKVIAPEQRRIVAFDRVESPWPVMGSVLVHDGVAFAIAGRLTRVDGGMWMVAMDPVTGERIWRQHLAGIYGAEAHILPQSWQENEEHMTNNLLLAKDGSLRLYDEFGTWQFSARDGRLEGRSHEVGQPGWPRGRKTPPCPAAAERWPWCGWDRVTQSELMAGADATNSMVPGMHPYTRGVPKYQAWLFPDRERWGVHGIRLNKEKKFQLEPARFTERTTPPEKMPWKPRLLDLDVKAYAFAGGGEMLLVAGGTPVGPHHKGGQLRATRMKDGRDLSVLDFSAPAVFDGLAAAYERVYASTTDGRVLCFGGPDDE